jgi:cytochrome c-type biogenesis protein CcsB
MDTTHIINFFLFEILLIIFFLATLGYLSFLVTKKPFLAWLATALTVVSFTLDTIAILFKLTITRISPFSNSKETLFLFIWATILVFLIVDLKYHIPVLGAFVIPIAFILFIYAYSLPEGKAPLPSLPSYWIGLHAIVAILGYAIFAIASCAAIMYLIQERQLKSKKPGPLYYRLPSLEVLDNLSYRALSIGFPLLTLAIIIGAIWAKFRGVNPLSRDPTTIFAIIVWIIYAILIYARVTAGWRGRKASYLTILGFSYILITFMAIYYFSERGLHLF